MRLALPGLFVAVAAALLAAGGCAGGTTTNRASSDVERFVALASSGVNIDYTPLSSPRDAIEKSDLVVEGTVSAVIDGVRLQYPDPLYTQRKAGSYATLVISVDRVLSGDASKVVGGRVYVEVHKSRTSTIGDLSGANPRPRTVAVLDDITTWKPSPEVTVTRPAGVPATAPLYAAFSDGIWLDDDENGPIHGLYASPDELAPAWGAPMTLNAVSAAIRSAGP